MIDKIRSFFRNLTSAEPAPAPPPPVVEETETAPLTEAQLQTITLASHQLEPAQLITCTGISVGKVREHNEDSLYTASAVIAAEEGNFNFGIFIVADGLGGHEQGDIASEAAVRTMADHLMSHYFNAFFGTVPETPEESVQEILESGVAKAHRIVEQRAPEGGTTLTTVLILGNRMSIAHVGDSRAYLVHPDGRLDRLTRDHSWVEKLIEIGQLTPEEAETHPKRHDLYRALGKDVSGEPDISTATLSQTGYLLLCSDGLWNVVPEADISRLVTSAPNIHSACAKLIETANAAGGPDNISVILVQLPGM